MKGEDSEDLRELKKVLDARGVMICDVKSNDRIVNWTGSTG